MTLRHRIWRAARHVQSGNYPLYRLVVSGVLISGILQVAVQEAPPSVVNTSPVVFDFIYLGMQAIGAAVVLASFFVHRALLSLNLERVGAVGLATAGYMYFAAVWLNNGGVPLTAATWTVFMLSIYLTFRVPIQIPREIREVETTAEQIARDRHDG